MVSVKFLSIVVSAGLFGLQAIALPIPNQITSFKHTSQQASRSLLNNLDSNLEKRASQEINKKSAEPVPSLPYGNSRVWRHARSVKPAAEKRATEGISSRSPAPSASVKPTAYNSRIWRHRRNVAPQDTKPVVARAPVPTPNASGPISRVWRHAKVNARADTPKLNTTPKVEERASSAINSIVQSSPAWRLAARATNSQAAPTATPQVSRVWRHRRAAAPQEATTKTMQARAVEVTPKSTTASAPIVSATSPALNSRVWRHARAVSPKDAAPKVETPKVEAPKAEAPKVEAPKVAEASKVVEAPKVVETPAPKVVETPKVEAPKATEAPKAAETPKATKVARSAAPAAGNSRVWRHVAREAAPAPMNPLYEGSKFPAPKAAAAAAKSNSRVWRHAARSVPEAPKSVRSEAPKEESSPPAQTSRVWRYARGAASESSNNKGYPYRR